MVTPSSDLTDILVYTLEQRWEILRQINLQKMLLLSKKKISFQLNLILILAGMKTSKIDAFGAQKIRTHTLKSRRTQNESLFKTDFGPEA